MTEVSGFNCSIFNGNDKKGFRAKIIDPTGISGIQNFPVYYIFKYGPNYDTRGLSEAIIPKLTF